MSSHILLAVMLVLLVIDWRQTLTIAREPSKWRERNLVLSWLIEHVAPLVGRDRLVTAYFMWAGIFLALGTAYVWSWMPALCLPLEAWCVWNNRRLGIELAPLASALETAPPAAPAVREELAPITPEGSTEMASAPKEEGAAAPSRSSIDNDALIEMGLRAGVGSEDVKLWEHGAAEREHAEASLLERLHGWHARLEKLEAGLAENTAATGRIETNTAAIVEAFNSLQGAMNVLQAIGKFARPVSYIAMAGSAIVGLFYTVKGGTPPQVKP